MNRSTRPRRTETLLLFKKLNRLKSQVRDELGFTLIEIMVALAIVGIISGIAMFKIGNYRDQTSLRQSAESYQQVVSWAKLQAEKSGVTVFVKISLPTLYVYRDKNSDGKWDAADSLIMTDSISRTVKLFKPAIAPSEASVAAPASGLADGDTTCGTGVCCTLGSGTKPTWSDSVVSFCPRTSPQLSPLMEEGAIYMASTNSGVPEVWAVVVNPDKSLGATLWTSSKVPAAATDWRKVR